jgi:hypothetical protein
MVWTLDAEMAPDDVRDLRQALVWLEENYWVASLLDVVGRPIDAVVQELPPKVAARIGEITRKAVMSAAHTAIFTMDADGATHPWSRAAHKSAVVLTGSVSGFLGLESVALELPISTVVMLRSIADIAKANGEDVRDPDTQLAVVSVLAMGKSDFDGYIGIREWLALETSRAAREIAERGLSREAGASLSRWMARVAERFSIQVSDKVAAQAVPVIGAVFGGTINWMFIDVFQRKAAGHFTVRRLERKYGQDRVREVMDRLRAEPAEKA